METKEKNKEEELNINILNTLEKEFNLKRIYVKNIIDLIDKGNTIPFIARYRKELTNSLDDQILRKFYERLVYLKNLEEKRNSIKDNIESKGALTEEILKNLEKAKTIAEIDDIYRPFKEKKRTRATVAKEKGLEEIAKILWDQNIDKNIEDICKNYINEEKGVNSIEEVLQGAKDIIAEIISDISKIRKIVRENTINLGYIVSKRAKEEDSVYDIYYNFKEKIKTIPRHRVLALNRGEKEGFLNIKIEVEEEIIFNLIYLEISKRNKYTDSIVKETIVDSYKRLISKSIEREIRSSLTERSQEESIKLFGENLRQLLLQKPIKGKTVLAIDPGFRTGCKIAVLDETGKVLDVGVIYPTKPQEKIEEAKNIVINIIEKYNIDLISIGNGTASKETEIFISDLLNNIKSNINYLIVNESGASVYSASKLGAEEFPDFDVSLRSAVSIGRRIQDPLAELVKIDPKSIGVGQYQHDMNQKKLSETLKGVVEGCVNIVGVDLNTASLSLLSYIAGITKPIAKNILDYRNKQGKFRNREELLKINKLGPKIFEQCAGFLRISEKDGENPLDSTGIHPESYDIARNILKKLNYTLEDIKNKSIKGIKNKIVEYEKFAEEISVGLPTLEHILKEFEKPGRDPRENITSNILRKDIINIEDLKKGMKIEGIVRNITDFGVFVDIGVHQDGLVHISNMSEKFIKHPLDIVNIGDIVKVEVLDIDTNKNKISLTMKDKSKNKNKV